MPHIPTNDKIYQLLLNLTARVDDLEARLAKKKSKKKAKK